MSADGSQATSSKSHKTLKPKTVPGEYLVKFRAPTDSAYAATVLNSAAFSTRRSFRSVPGLYHIVANIGIAPVAAAARLARDPSVEYVEPNFIVRAEAVPNDPMFAQLWGLNNSIGFGGNPGPDIGAEAAWNITTGSANVVLAVIDSGIDYTHPDLAGNVWVNTPGCNGVDTDGYPSDCHGINAITGSGDPMDDFFHGTHVSGIMGAVGNNAIGITGVNWTTALLGCKFLDSTGSGTTADAVTCLDYVALQKTRGVNIVATNNSWGSPTYSQALSDAISAQLDLGILFIAAAGNTASDNDVTPTYPCSYDHSNIICVASAVDFISDFSDYGLGTVHLAAPGESILSTVLNGQYADEDGTSMATAFVTGVAGLLAAQNPTRDWRAIKNLILAGAVPPTQYSIPTVTGGRLRAINSMSCSNSIVEARQRPGIFQPITIAVGASLKLEAVNINCAAPNGNVVVSVEPGGGTVTLVDDGTGYDEAAGDGVYTGAFVGGTPGTYTLTFPGRTGDVVTVVVDPLLKPGFPTQMYLQADEGGQTPLPTNQFVVGAIDSGPGLEIIATGYTAGPLYAWKADGTLEPGWPNYDIGETVNVSLGTFAAGAPNGVAAAGYYSSELYLYSGDDTLISGWPQQLAVPYPPPTVDLDGSGVDAIISIPAFNANGTLLGPASSIPAAPPANAPYLNAVAIADLNAVGESDFIEANADYVWASNVQGMLPGFPAVSPVSGAGPLLNPVVGDVEGIGRPDIIVATYMTTGAGGSGLAYLAIEIFDNHGVLRRTLNTVPSEFSGIAPVALGDLDGDGIPEIVIATGNQLYAWKGDGTVMPGFPVTLPTGESSNSPVTIGDITGDGYPDIALVSSVDGTSMGNVHVFDRQGVELAGFPRPLFSSLGGQTAIADIDGSGRNDLIVSAAPNPGLRDNIFVYDLQGPPNSGPIEWGQYMGGANLRGYYQTGKNLTTTAYLTAQAHGAGVISSSDGAINCGGNCIHLYADGSKVSLTAMASPGGIFSQWNGACSGQGNPCTVTVNSYSAVSADFSSPVEVNVVGDGNVASTPLGINCPARQCIGIFPARTSVLLTATPASGYVFSSWGGNCSGTALTCTLAINSAASVVATFVNHYTLSVAYTGAGTETLGSKPAGLNCGAVCQASFPPGTRVTLSAAYSPTTYIADWGVPGCSVFLATCNITLNTDVALTVTLAEKLPFAISVSGNGSLQVANISNSPTGPVETCTGSCTFYEQPGASFDLTATPASNSYFASWGGACSGTVGTFCETTFAAGSTASVQFDLDPQLTITIAGSGQGSVYLAYDDITGVNCSATCVESLPTGTYVTLSPSPASGSSFAGWSGACSGTAPTCSLTMSENQAVGVTFNSQPQGVAVRNSNSGPRPASNSSGAVPPSADRSGGGAIDFWTCAALLFSVLARSLANTRHGQIRDGCAKRSRLGAAAARQRTQQPN